MAAGNDMLCAHDGCENSAFKDGQLCALHCEKQDYSNDRRSGLLRDFYELLVEYIANQLFGEYSSIDTFTEKHFKEFAKGKGHDEIISVELRSQILCFNEISFPARDGRDPYDYEKILKQLKGSVFYKCRFYCRKLSFNETAVFFQSCTFCNDWSLSDYKLLDNVYDVIYQECKFLKVTCVYEPDDGLATLTSNQFDYECEFLTCLSIENVHLTGELFSSAEITQAHRLKANKIIIFNALVVSKLVLNNLDCIELALKDVECQGKFELKNSSVDQLEIDNCNFSKVSDLFNSRFVTFKIEKSIFNEFAGFERCAFGSKSLTQTKQQIAVFKFVTFFDFASFRDSIYHSGLSLSRSNFRSPPNFHSALIESKFTDRETYRIIKHSFDAVGNKIDANKYFSLELGAYRSELFSKKYIVRNKLSRFQLCQQRVVFFINHYGSSFGQSYFRPLILIAIFMLAFMFLGFAHDANWLYRIAPQHNETIAYVVGFFNSFAKSLIPLTRLQKEGMEFLSLLFAVVFSVLIWLTITSIKSYTKR